MKKIRDYVSQVGDLRDIYQKVIDKIPVVVNFYTKVSNKVFTLISNNPKTTTAIWAVSLYVTWRLS